MLAMGPRNLNSAPYSPVHCSSHSMTSFQSSELTELPVGGEQPTFRTARAQRVHSARYAPQNRLAPRAEHQEHTGPGTIASAKANRASSRTWCAVVKTEGQNSATSAIMAKQTSPTQSKDGLPLGTKASNGTGGHALAPIRTYGHYTCKNGTMLAHEAPHKRQHTPEAARETSVLGGLTLAAKAARADVGTIGDCMRPGNPRVQTVRKAPKDAVHSAVGEGHKG